MSAPFARRALLQLGLSAGLFACSSDKEPASNSAGEGDTRVTIYSWWVAASEADALNALIDVHRAAYPHEEIVNAAIASGENAHAVLDAQLSSGGTPPDLFQENVYHIADFLNERPNGLQPLDDLFEELGLADVIVPEVLQDITVDGQIMTMPVNIHRENSLLFNQRILTEQGLEPPTTLDDFLSTCETLKQAGIVPLAAAHVGWMVRILFNGFAPAVMGIDQYVDYFSGKSELDETALRSVIQVLGKVLDEYVNTSASDPTFNWTSAADLVLTGEAAMFIHGDWAKGYLVEQGLEPGDGFGVVGAPGAADLFLYGVDVFAMPAGAPHPEQAKDFLRSVASKAGQVAFNKIKGSTPIRLDAGIDDLDPVGRAILNDLQNARVRMVTRSQAEWDDAFAAFATTGDADALIQNFRDYPPS